MYIDQVSQYFVPNGTGVLAVEDTSQANAVHGEMLCVKKCAVSKLKFITTVAVLASTTEPVVEFNRRPTPGSSSGEVKIGDITIPNGTAIGKVMYKKVEPVVMYPGDALAFEQTTQATHHSTAAGSGFYAVEILDVPEEDANSTDMIESA